MWELTEPFDSAVDSAFVALRRHKAADKLAFLLSEAADYSLLWHAIGATAAVLTPRRLPHSIRMAVMLGLESLLVNGILKRLAKRPRPELLENRLHEVRRPKTSSFPSGHASSAAVMAVLMTESVPKLGPFWIALAALVGASRVHNRMHHGSDVVAGAVLGLAASIVAKRVWPL